MRLTLENVAPDHDLLRQISSLVATLPTIDAPEFRKELETVSATADARICWLTFKEYEDVQLTAYLSNITKQLSALNDVSPFPKIANILMVVHREAPHVIPSRFD